MDHISVRWMPIIRFAPHLPVLNALCPARHDPDVSHAAIWAAIAFLSAMR